MKECPSCGARIRGNAIKCPECNTSLDVNQEFICMNCERRFFGKRNVCPHCGSKNIYKKSEYL